MCSSHYSSEQLNEWVSILREPAYSLILTTHKFFVAEDRGLLLGFCILDSTEGFINATYINPTASRHGIGRALVKAAEAAAQAAGLTRIRLNSTLNAVAFYECLGYLRGDMASNRLPTGVELPCVTMSKALAG
jgi:putative acetyltransferase